jgi:hypothetical protein
MLKLKPNPTFVVPVTIPVPGGGDTAIEITVKHMGRDALRAFLDEAKDRDDLSNVSGFVVDWRGVDVEFSQDALASILNNYPLAATAMLDAYLAEIGRAAAKN